MPTTETIEKHKSRTAARLTIRYAIVIAAGLATVWLLRLKSVNDPVSPVADSADPRLVPALEATLSLVALLVIALLMTIVVPGSRRPTAVAAVTVALVLAGLFASGTVLFSAGFVIWPIWS